MTVCLVVVGCLDDRCLADRVSAWLMPLFGPCVQRDPTFYLPTQERIHDNPSIIIYCVVM